MQDLTVSVIDFSTSGYAIHLHTCLQLFVVSTAAPWIILQSSD